MSEVKEAARLNGAAIIAEIKEAGVKTVAALPDITTSAGLLWPLASDKDLRLVRVCKEDEGISICSALSYCGHRAVMSMQQTGLFDSLNAIRSFAVEYSHPVCMLVGLLGKEPGVPPEQSKKYGVRIVEPVLRAMEIDHLVIETDAEIPRITEAIKRAYDVSRPVVVLFGTRVRP